MSTDPSVAYNATNNSNRLADIRDGNIYNTQNLALLGNGNGWKSVNLTNSLTDLTANIAASLNWFGVGFHTYEGANGHTYCYIEASGYSSSSKPYLLVVYNDNVTVGTFTLNGQAANINACPGSVVTIAHTGWNNGGGTMAYYVGTENPVNSSWVSTWDILSGGCPNQNSCSFTVPNVAEGTRLIVHSNAYNGCTWGPGVTRIITVTCCATTNAGTLQNQNTVVNLCYGQTVSANNITSTSLNAGNGTLRTVWFVGEWGWNGTAMGWINWRESTPGAPAGNTYSANLNGAVGGGNGDGQSMTNYNPLIDFPNNNRFYIIRGSYNPTCASWCVPACVYQGFEVIIRPPIPTPTVSNSGPICVNSSITLSADGLAPQGKSLAATSAAAQMTIPNATLGASWTLEAWSRFPLNNSGTYNTLFRNAGGGGGGGDHQILCENGILGSWSNTGTNGSLGFKSSGFNVTTLSAGWHHVAAIASGGITRFYIDGTIVGQIAWQSNNSVELINGLTATQAWGEIDNVRIWNTARSVGNLLQDMHRNVPTLDLPNLIANYTFDASNGNALNNGTYNASGIINSTYNNVSFFTYTWSGTNAPAPSTSNTQTVTNPSPGNYSLTVSVNNCSSTAAVTAVAGSPSPTGATSQTFCSTVSPTIANLTVTGTAIQWYSTATGGNALPLTFGLSNGVTYYATQTIAGCESPIRLAVTVTINPVAVSPAITGTTNLCFNGTTTLTPNYPTGGTVTDAGGYRTHTFTANGTFTVPTGFSGVAEVLVVGGGGGGGGIIGGGGGAGGLRFSTVSLTPGAKTVVIGAGGQGGIGWNNAGQQGGKGGDSQFDATTAIGGGGGGLHGGNSGAQGNLWNGGSGGGAGNTTTGFGTGTAGQGNNGGTGGSNNGGGGGGFTSIGGNGLGTQACCTGGTSGGSGGSGVYFPQFTSNGSPVGWFAGGGGGGTRDGNGTAGIGGNGGGTNGTSTSTQAASSPANTGGGGGGGGYNGDNTARVGGNGGSGIVIIRYYIGTPVWSSQNTAIATVTNGTVTGSAPGGSTTIDYTVAAVGGCASTNVSIPVNVIGGQRIAPTGQQCSGTQLNFEALPNPSISGTTISWTVTTPSGLSATPTSGNTNLFSTTITNTTAGDLSPTITISQTIGGLTCTRNFSPVIKPIPVATISGNLTFCQGGSTTLTASGGGTYLWSNGLGNTASAVVNTTGNYVVTVSLNGCDASANVNVLMSTLSVAPTSIIGNNNICSGASTTLTTDGGSLGTDAEDYWYEGQCPTECYTQEWLTQPFGLSGTTQNSVSNGILNVTSTNIDPGINMTNVGAFSASSCRYISIRYRVISGTGGNVEIYFSKNGGSDLVQANMQSGVLVSNGQWNILNIDMGVNAQWTGTITGWRFDWSTASNVTMEIDFITLSNTPIFSQSTSITVSPTSTTTYFTLKKGLCNTTTCVSSTVTISNANTAGIASSSPTVCLNTAIAPSITIITTGAAGIGIATGLPAGVSAIWSTNTITISGTPTASGTFNYSIPLTGGCGNVNATGTITVSDIIDWVNLQWPPNGSICQGGTFDIYGQLYNTGTISTIGAGVAAAGVSVEFGYSITNTNPSTWTNWSAATFNPAGGGTNNDEYMGTLSGLTQGTYFYTFRYQINGCGWQYGGFSADGGNIWNGSTYVSGVLTINPIPTVDVSCSNICSGTTTTVTATPTPAGTYNYNWTVPNGATPQGTSVTNFSTGIAGTYSVTITNTTTNCSSLADACTISVQALPSVIYLSPP